MKKFFTVISLFFVVFSAMAQKVRFDIKFTSDNENIEKVYVQPLNVDVESKTVPLRLKGELYTGTVALSGIGFYNVVVLKDNSQLILPVYVGDSEQVALDVEIKGKTLFVNDTRENRSLSALTAVINSLDRSLWVDSDMSGTALKSLISNYQLSLDSIIAQENVSGVVVDYMRVYAYTHAYNAYASIPRAQEVPITSIPFGRYDVLPNPNVAFDNGYAPLFFAAMQIVKDDLTTSPSLLDKLYSLYDNYKNEALREKVASLVMSEFMSKFDYSKGFYAGLELIKTATATYGLSDVYVKEFMKNKSTIPGSPFPDGVTLVDENGKSVDFSKFKGKYVYLDLWASWCGPCCKEVPHMKRLEKSLNNDNVVFLSVSCDTDVQAWKSKMKELGMEGYQLLDKDNTLGDALNVKGIPFYVIYDKEGCLHTYGAMRPSAGQSLKKYLEDLK